MTNAFLPTHKRPKPNYGGYVVIGAELPRKATMSTQAALEKILNEACYHMLTIWEEGNTEAEHRENMVGGKLTDEDWRRFLVGRGFRTGVDYHMAHHLE